MTLSEAQEALGVQVELNQKEQALLDVLNSISVALKVCQYNTDELIVLDTAYTELYAVIAMSMGRSILANKIKERNAG